MRCSILNFVKVSSSDRSRSFVLDCATGLVAGDGIVDWNRGDGIGSEI